MPFRVRASLSTMMFLNWFVWGTWYVTLGTYLTATLKFSGTQAGAVFGTTALASMISPFFIGLIADKWFPMQRVLAALHVIGAVFLFLITQATSFPLVYALMLAYNLCYFPTIGLTTSIALRQVDNPGAQFPGIRVWATIGWIAIGLIIGNLGIETSSTPFLIATASSIVMALFSLTLPNTPPTGKAEKPTIRTVLGLDALVMLKDRSFLIFVVSSVLACIPLTFYFSFTNAYLNDVGVQNAAGKMTLGQASEIIMMILMPWVFRRVTIKGILVLGLFAWALRYALLAFGNPGSGMWMFYAAIILHGICYDFSFMTGQLYTDQEAPADLRGTAQGFFTFLTYGVGIFLGSMASGIAVDIFTDAGGRRNWSGVWLSSAIGSAAILFLVAAFFRSSRKIGETPASAGAAEAAG